MHQTRFRFGFCPETHTGSAPLAEFKGLNSEGGAEKKGGEEWGRIGKR